MKRDVVSKSRKGRVLVLVPTLGERTESLDRTLNSLSQSGPCDVWLVSPRDLSRYLQNDDFVNITRCLNDPGKGLAYALNHCIQQKDFPSYDFFLWINDDDWLTEDSITRSSETLEKNPDATMVFGDCLYQDEFGNNIWSNHFGETAKRFLRFGPDLIPQPSCLFSVQSTLQVGGMDPTTGLAFDYDFILRLSALGKIIYIPVTQSIFTWHPESLTVNYRWSSVSSAAKVRWKNGRKIRPILCILNPIVMLATYVAGVYVSMTRRAINVKQTFAVIGHRREKK